MYPLVTLLAGLVALAAFNFADAFQFLGFWKMPLSVLGGYYLGHVTGGNVFRARRK